MSQTEPFRTFLAITPDEKVLDSVEEKIGALRRGLEFPGIRWEPRSKWHITLRFLGDVEAAEVPELCAAIDEVCRGRSGFSAKVANVGAFPSLKRPRVLWAGIETEGEYLEDLHKSLRTATDRFANKPDEKRFRPHLTLARMKTESRRTLSQIAPAVHPFSDLDFGSWNVDGVELWRSLLKPGGSQYELLNRTPLHA